MKEKEEKVAEFKKSDDLLDERYQPKPLRPGNAPSGFVPPIRAIIAAAIDRIGPYSDLDNKQQVVAMIDEVYNFYLCHKTSRVYINFILFQ